MEDWKEELIELIRRSDSNTVGPLLLHAACMKAILMGASPLGWVRLAGDTWNQCCSIIQAESPQPAPGGMKSGN